ncbi:hypothetical protein N9937_00880 [bacterium]|nr:hypothetical protein [bacterium]
MTEDMSSERIKEVREYCEREGYTIQNDYPDDYDFAEFLVEVMELNDYFGYEEVCDGVEGL